MNFEELGRKVKKFSRSTMEEVQKMNEVRQLNGKINEAHKQIRNLYSEMGKKLYDHYKEEALAGFEAEIHAISDKFVRIEELKEQIRQVKGVVLCPCCHMEVSATERFCSNCGNKMPEVFEIVDDDEQVDAVVVESEDVTEPKEVQKSAEEEKPEAVQDPAEEEKPETVQESEEEEKPEAVQDPTEEEKLETVQDPTEEAEPEAVQKPAEEEKPDAVQESVENVQSEAVQDPKEEEKTETVQDPAEKAEKEMAGFADEKNHI